MGCVFPAETAVFAHFNTIRIIFLIFYGIVVALFAFVTSKCNLNTHFAAPPKFIIASLAANGS